MGFIPAHSFFGWVWDLLHNLSQGFQIPLKAFQAFKGQDRWAFKG